MALREFLSNRLAVAGLVMLLFFVVFCFIGPLVYHTNQIYSSPLGTDLAPAGGHLLGTDDNGFDELGRIMAGGQTALEIGFFSAAIATVIGTIYGAVSGLAGGLLDGVLMRFIESQVYQGALENVASEMAARMVSMKSASDNAGKLIESLQLVYNKARQAAITKELAEIVGGAAAV